MEDKDLKYNKVLDKLKKTEPVLNDAEELTDRIMQKVEQTVGGDGRTNLMRISGLVSGIAASALICLLVYETLKYPVMPVENVIGAKKADTVEKMYPRMFAELYHKEKAEIIEILIKRREAQRMRKEQLSAALNIHNKKVTH